MVVFDIARLVLPTVLHARHDGCLLRPGTTVLMGVLTAHTLDIDFDMLDMRKRKVGINLHIASTQMS